MSDAVGGTKGGESVIPMRLVGAIPVLMLGPQLEQILRIMAWKWSPFGPFGVFRGIAGAAW